MMASRKKTPRRMGVNERNRRSKTRQQRAQNIKTYSQRTVRIAVKLALVLTVLSASAWASFTVYEKAKDTNLLVLKNVNIEGNRLLSWDNLIALVGVEMGTSMWDLPLDTISERLNALPLVSQVQVKRQWPFTLKINLQEVQPLFNLIREHDIAIWSDKSTIMPTDVHLATSLPYVRATDEPSLAASVDFLNIVKQQDPDLYHNISQVVVHSQPLYFEVYMRDVQHKVKFAPHNLSAEVFAQYQLLAKGLSAQLTATKVIDLRFQGMVVAVQS
jgi:cell division septal protein FtsQ